MRYNYLSLAVFTALVADGVTFAVAAAIMPVLLFELNPITAWIVGSYGVGIFLLLKIVVGLIAAKLNQVVGDYGPIKMFVAAVTTLTFMGALSNINAILFIKRLYESLL